MQIVGGIWFDFDRSPISIIQPGEFIVVVENLVAFNSRYETQGMLVAGEYSGRLSNGGEYIAVLDPLEEVIHSFTYLDLWYPETDGLGASLVVNHPEQPKELWDEAAGWRTSAEVMGSPGAEDANSRVPAGQRPGDANQDGVVDLSDTMRLLILLYRPGGADLPCAGATIQDGGNRTLLDVNGDQSVNISDAIYMLNYLFRGGSPPALGTGCIAIEMCGNVCR
jgi:hypothetical protein